MVYGGGLGVEAKKTMKTIFRMNELFQGEQERGERKEVK